MLEFRPSVGQGFGNTQRVRGYSPEERTYDHGGVMDTCLKGEFTRGSRGRCPAGARS